MSQTYEEWFIEQVDQCSNSEQEVHNFLEDEINRTEGELPLTCREYAQLRMAELSDGRSPTDEAYDDLAAEWYKANV